MAFQPPTRPHSANPHIILNSSIFPRPTSAASNRTKAPSPTKLNSKNRRSHEWDDAWDSGSDHDNEDDGPGLKGIGPAPIPIRPNGNGHQRQSSTGSVVAASWASGSYQHISHRPALNTAKTYTEGATPPTPGTASPTTATGNGESSGSKLPPGGAWELVEPVVEEDEAPPPRAGKEAIREDVDAILRGMYSFTTYYPSIYQYSDPLQLLSSLHISNSAPTTPSTGPTNPSSIFPFLASTQVSSSSSSSNLAAPQEAGSTTPKSLGRKEGINRQRSVRTERRREKFAKVLRGRDEDGGGVDLGEPIPS